MKRIIVSLLAMVLMISYSSAFADGFTIHNGVTFGMTKNEVMDAETSGGFSYSPNSGPLFGQCMKHDSFLDFSGTLVGIDGAGVEYHFNSLDNLECAIYALAASEKKNGTLETFSNLAKSLESKYGSDDTIAKLLIENRYLDCCVYSYFKQWDTEYSKVEISNSKAFTYKMDNGDTVIIYLTSLNVAMPIIESNLETVYIFYQIYDADTYSDAYTKIESDTSNAYDDL